VFAHLVLFYQTKVKLEVSRLDIAVKLVGGCSGFKFKLRFVTLLLKLEKDINSKILSFVQNQYR